jgi:predicted RNase H-like HicB family nuclease
MEHEGYMTLVIRDVTTSGARCYLAMHPELAGCMATGVSEDEARENLADARQLYISALKRRGLNVPLPYGGMATIGTARSAATATSAIALSQRTANEAPVLVAASS